MPKWLDYRRVICGSSDDTGLGGVTIFIDKDGNSSLSAGDLSTVTASDGSWSFTGLDATVAGKKILEIIPGGYIETVGTAGYTITGTSGTNQTGRSEERRVGKEGRSRWSPDH